MFLTGIVFASCKTSQPVAQKPQAKPAPTSPAPDPTGPQYVPWKQSLIDSWAHKTHEKIAITVVNSDEIKLFEKGATTTEYVSNAIAKTAPSFTATIPAKTTGSIDEFMEINSTRYLRVSFPFKNGTVVTVFFKEDTDGSYVLCTNEKLTKMNVFQAVYQGKNLSLSVDPEQQKKCVLLVSVTPVTVQTNITEQ